MTLTVQREDTTAVLTLRRPAAGNRLDAALATALAETWRHLATDSALRAIILTGEGEVFCEGSEGELPVAIDPAAYECWKPVIVAVNGRCAGAGLRFVGYGDIILAAEEATFAGAPLSEGVPFEDLLAQRRRLALPLAELLILSGGGWTLDAARALAVGWVSEVVPRAQLLARAQELARTLAANDPWAVQRTKEILVRGRDLFLRDALELARAAVPPLAANPAARAAILARQRPH
ncbi:MAG: crotonase [Dehalococcoidia bacterium]|nr:MAG: crotonase [Dehalococcoidia bacterium]